jgi:branched-chain amino acid transport system permease protein
MAQVLGSIVFVVVVIGGLGSIGGAFVASLAIGVIQTFAVALDYSLSDVLRAVGLRSDANAFLADLWKLTIAQVAPIVPYLLLVLILILRPTGLFGTRET